MEADLRTATAGQRPFGNDNKRCSGYLPSGAGTITALGSIFGITEMPAQVDQDQAALRSPAHLDDVHVARLAYQGR